jgi:hypothetical protein
LTINNDDFKKFNVNELSAEQRNLLKENLRDKEMEEIQSKFEKHEIKFDEHDERFNKVEKKQEDMHQEFIDNSITQRHNEISKAIYKKAYELTEKHFSYLKNKENGKLFFDDKKGHVSFRLFVVTNRKFGVSSYRDHVEKNVDTLIEFIKNYDLNEDDLDAISSYLPKNQKLKIYLKKEYQKQKEFKKIDVVKKNPHKFVD